jgi:uncharacterized membrane protein YesL
MFKHIYIRINLIFSIYKLIFVYLYYRFQNYLTQTNMANIKLHIIEEFLFFYLLLLIIIFYAYITK